MKYIRVLVIAVMLTLSCGAASQATVLTFEGLQSGDFIPNGYGGLNWNNMAARNSATPGNGYYNGLVSGDMVAYNQYANMAVTSSTSNFNFLGAYLTGAWNDGLSVQVRGLAGGIEKYNSTVVTSAYSPTYFTFGFLDVDTLEFTSFGGTDQGFGGGGTHFAMDNFTYNQVPLPGALLLFGPALAGLGLLRRRFAK